MALPFARLPSALASASFDRHCGGLQVDYKCDKLGYFWQNELDVDSSSESK